MTAKQLADASSTSPLTWRSIDWRGTEEEVRRLQIRIAKATQAGLHGVLQEAPMLCMARIGWCESGSTRSGHSMNQEALIPVAAGAPITQHRLERLEPYEGKLSRTVLRGA